MQALLGKLGRDSGNYQDSIVKKFLNNPVSVNPGKKIKTQDCDRARFPEKILERSVALIVYFSVLWIFFPESVLGDGPKKSLIGLSFSKIGI